MGVDNYRSLRKKLYKARFNEKARNCQDDASAMSHRLWDHDQRKEAIDAWWEELLKITDNRVSLHMGNEDSSSSK